jgi:hypothetical protein
MPRGELETLLKETRQAEPVPGFQHVWRQAEAMQSLEEKTTYPLRRMLIPVAATAAIALLLVAGIHFALQSNGNEQNLAVQDGTLNPSERLAHLNDIEPWTGKLDGLGTEWTFELTSLESLDDDEVDTSVVAVSTNIPGDDIYESQTDFLLDLEVPTWKQAVERNVL